jgi:glucose/arabinose dehydrogenase
MREQRESHRLKAQEQANTVEPGRVFQSQRHAFTLQPVIEMPGILWAADFLPDGSLLTTQIDGTLWHVVDGKRTAITGTPKVYAEGQGGLLDVKVHASGWVYLTFAEKSDRGAMTAVVRGKIQGGRWVEQQDIFRLPPAQHIDTNWHYGSRLAIVGDYLFFSVGDRGKQDMAQDPARPNGKIHRVHLDGRIPKDNPFRQRGFASVWSLGHRNPQGLDAHPVTGDIWESEHGPRGGDEVNHIRRGLNFGWPRATHGMNYDGTAIAAEPVQPGMEEPARYWTPSISPGGIAFYMGERYPQWKGNLFVGGQGARELHRLTLEGNQVVADETVMSGQGRVRDVVSGADGYLYVVLNNPEPAASGIYRLVPVAADPMKLIPKPVLTMALAQKMAMACVKHQQETDGPPVDIAIYDDGARLIYFVAMDGTSSGTGPTAMAKGESSARFRYSSAEIGGWVKGNPGVGHVPGLLGVRGGLPISTGSGTPLGGIGVSGAPSEVDERCARVGIEAIAPELRGD